MMRNAMLSAAILGCGISSAHALSDLTSHTFLEGTGRACLSGGALVGLGALVVGPTVITASVGGSVVLPSTITTGVASLLGCGSSAAVALVYYGFQWTYKEFIAPPRYPLLYPSREELSKTYPAK
ncbi:conserved exported hypothetical protein [Gammaproteobacteria bacterium]